MSVLSAKNLSARSRKNIAARLLAWYATHKRALPWRRDAHDPYRVWISETLLQQTQVAIVIPYYERFLARFPTVHALASAPLDDVLKTWEGAGYYARARNLHRAAQEIVARFDGNLPSTVEELRALPGIGRYTAGAVASIAFQRDAPVLDGNVTRVLCRYFKIESDSKSKATQDSLWELVTELVPHGLAGEFNQAVMELGATVCSPRKPACDACPLKRGCAARRAGIQDELPIKQKKKPLPHHEIAVGVIWKRGKVLIARRKDDALLGGLWEFPGGHREKRESLEKCAAREVREELGIEIAVGEKFAEVEHAYSHFAITLHAFQCKHVRGRPRAIGCAAFKWVAPDALSRYAFPKANLKVIEKMRL
ncbi:MAG: A/G-specific adenine glycosylase [Chloroflexi bacterium]|nr:A/G-specific adenine glycosylase [Chloroflexota bacterium]